MHRFSRLGSMDRGPARSVGATAAILAVFLNLVLPLALAARERADDRFDFAAAICHGGAAAVSTAGVEPASPQPVEGSAGHDCCPACVTPLAHALMPPPAVGIANLAAMPLGPGIHRSQPSPTDPGQLSFRSRAPPFAA